MHKEKNIELIEMLRKLNQYGYKSYSTSKGDWCYTITPDDNVLYIQPERFGRYGFSLQYIPSRECGTGCQCLENPVDEVNLEIIQQAEQKGLTFAWKLKAPMFKNSEEWKKKYWAADYLEEIK